MESLIQQLYRKRLEKQNELEKKASASPSSTSVSVEKMGQAVSMLEKCAVDWSDVTAKIVGTAAPAAIGVLGGAAIGGITHAIRPKAKDERERKKRLVRSLLTGAAFGGLAGAGVSAYSYLVGGHDKGHPLGFFDPTLTDLAGYTLAGVGARNSGLLGRRFTRPGELQVSVTANGRAAMDDIIRSFENHSIDSDTFLSRVFSHPDVAAIHGGSKSVPAGAVADDILRSAKYAVRYPRGGAFFKGGWRGTPKKWGGRLALLAGLGLIANKYTELFGDR